MRRISVRELKSNMILARAVENPSGGILLYEGARLREEQIQKLVDNMVTEVYVNDGNGKEASIYTIDTFQKESIDMIRESVETRIRTHDNDEMEEIIDTASSIIKEIVTNVDIANCMVNVKRQNCDMYTHMLSVASLSTIMAIKAGFSEDQLKDVAIGSLLHDIGLSSVEVPYDDIEISRMPAADKLNYRKHVITGYETVQAFNWISDTCKMIVLSHHERIDGSGYPFHKAGERIPPEVRIVSICDHFDEMINGIGYKKRRVHEVVEYFRTNETYLFDYELMNLVLSTIAWFPTGSKVKTNEGEIAVIYKQNVELPDRPVLKILKYADGRDCVGDVYKDLTEELTVFIFEEIE